VLSDSGSPDRANRVARHTNAFDTLNPAVTGTSTTWMAHQNNYENERMKLANLISLAGSIPCPIPPDASVEVNIPPPAAPTFLK